MIGNAVPYKLAEAIAKALFQQITNQYLIKKQSKKQIKFIKK